MSSLVMIVLLGALVTAAVAAVVGLVLWARQTSRSPVPAEGRTHEPVWEDRYGHHSRQAQGRTIQPPGGHSGDGP